MSDNNVQITSKGIKNSLKKYTSLKSICEYVWNGFDAKATQVIVEASENILGNNTMFDNRLGAQKKRAAANRLTPVCQTLASYVTKNCIPSKSQLKLILRTLDEIFKEYQINELKEPITNLKAYLKSLG